VDSPVPVCPRALYPSPRRAQRSPSWLSLRPRVTLRFSGALVQVVHLALSAELAPRAGDAHLDDIGVTLPAEELLDPRHIGALCHPALILDNQSFGVAIDSGGDIWNTNNLGSNRRAQRHRSAVEDSRLNWLR
jgi:hypothetical protein